MVYSNSANLNIDKVNLLLQRLFAHLSQTLLHEQLQPSLQLSNEWLTCTMSHKNEYWGMNGRGRVQMFA